MKYFFKLMLLLSSAVIANTLADNMVKIPAGEFMMGCSVGDTACGSDEGPAGGFTVNVPAFSIDKYEVTVTEYEQCMAAGKCTRPKDYKRNKYCNVGAKGREKHPANCIDWSDAVAYCEWKGKRLPMEAEWEKAARGGTASRYPWGKEVTCKQAILDDGKTFGSVPDEPDGCGEDRTWPVGSRQPNSFGLYDMHGNAGEWTMNWYAPNAIQDLYAKGDLKGPSKSRQRVVRGGSWDENTDNLRSSYRNVKPPVSGRTIYGSIGFRCALSN